MPGNEPTKRLTGQGGRYMNSAHSVQYSRQMHSLRLYSAQNL